MVEEKCCRGLEMNCRTRRCTERGLGSRSSLIASPRVGELGRYHRDNVYDSRSFRGFIVLRQGDQAIGFRVSTVPEILGLIESAAIDAAQDVQSE